MRRRLAKAGFFLAIAGSAAALIIGPAGAASVSVGISNDVAFTPKKLTVKKGTKVNWAWSGGEPHNVVFTSGITKKSATGASGSFSVKFKKLGTFRYVCTVHGFTGKVIVRK